MTTVDGLRLRRVLGRKEWAVPVPWGPDGWNVLRFDRTGQVIVTTSDFNDEGVEWTHASMSSTHGLPSYEDMCLLHEAVWGTTGYAYQVHAPAADHININEVLHLWGRADGARVLPDFGRYGTI